MKTTQAVLFTIFSLLGCATPKSPLPPVFSSQQASQEPPWPNEEHNRATMVWVEYHVLDTVFGKSAIETFVVIGVVVAPRTIVSQQFVSHNNTWIYNVQKITIVSVVGDWSGIPAVIVAETGGSDGDVVVLSTDNDLPNTRSAVFGGLPVYGKKAEGYYFEIDRSPLPWQNYFIATTSAIVKFSDNGQECYPSDQSRPNGSDAGHITFDKNHRLICVNWTSSAKVKRFLLANGIPFLEK